ncbi:hypothetical protein B0J11DRAFT_531202 [Dendryphion nanum]|uniref:Uncharacterized protein n=1 Tax=Dendryphion nanum TaxID=256645 RepID=A0A9P9DNT6_9PLEO|nr:hypothetical protein B0J11DRAFT_531202 [Dendryphion nanum]
MLADKLETSFAAVVSVRACGPVSLFLTNSTGIYHSNHCILHKSSYYFHLPPSRSYVDAGCPDLRCPIVPTFREWRFPHGQLPSLYPDIRHEMFRAWRARVRFDVADAGCTHLSAERSGMAV